jgi:hypothetical protein
MIYRFSLNLSYRETYRLTHRPNSGKVQVFGLPWKKSEANFGIFNSSHSTRTRNFCKTNSHEESDQALRSTNRYKLFTVILQSGLNSYFRKRSLAQNAEYYGEDREECLTEFT